MNFPTILIAMCAFIISGCANSPVEITEQIVDTAGNVIGTTTKTISDVQVPLMMEENTRKFISKIGMFIAAIIMIFYGVKNPIPDDLKLYYWQIVTGLLAACGLKTDNNGGNKQ